MVSEGCGDGSLDGHSVILTCILILSSSSTTENFSFTSFESVELPGWRKKKEKQKLNANLSYMVDNLFWINSTEN